MKDVMQLIIWGGLIGLTIAGLCVAWIDPIALHR